MTKILLVDDDPTGSDLLKMFLELETFEVLTARNLDNARTTLDKSFCIVLLDFHLSRNESGLVLLNEIRAGETNALTDIPIIVTSGDDRATQDALDQGASAFMHKPFAPSQLVEKIRELIQTRL